MRKETVVLATILTILGTNTNAARKTSRSAGGPKIVAGSRAATNVNVSGTTTTISATIADTTAGKTEYSEQVEGVYKGKIAPITDKQAERECTDLVVKALQNKCNGSKKCKNPTEIYATLDFENLGKDEDNKERTSKIPAEYRETYCANFLETAVNKLWNSYDSVATLNEENCNVALARSLAAEACYRELLADKNNDTMFKNNRDTSKCNSSSIVNMYKELTGDDNPGNDTLKKLQKNDISDVFEAVGKISWKTSILTNIGRFADLNFSGNTDEYPRELVQLVNSLKSQGNVMCGPERYTELYDTNFALSQTSSSIENAVKEKGILKGTFDWGLDQAGAIIGEDRIDAIKGRGMIPNKDEGENPNPTPEPPPAE